MWNRAAPYNAVIQQWPTHGNHILAEFDHDSVTVYQAYRPSIGRAAAASGKLGGGGFSFERMSWVKPNFLWMMYRSSWGTKPDQEVTLALKVRRAFFDELLMRAVASTFRPEIHASRAAWKDSIERSDVRSQWDPDHDPSGAPEQRRAIQLGVRGDALRELATDALLSVADVSEFVSAQRPVAESGDWATLMVPDERVYPVQCPSTRERLMLASWP